MAKDRVIALIGAVLIIILMFWGIYVAWDSEELTVQEQCDRVALQIAPLGACAASKGACTLNVEEYTTLKHQMFYLKQQCGISTYAFSEIIRFITE